MQSMTCRTGSFWKVYLLFYYHYFCYSVYFPIMIYRKPLSQEGPNNGGSKEMGCQEELFKGDTVTPKIASPLNVSHYTDR